MKPSLQHRLETLLERYEELAANLSSPTVIANQDKFRAYSKEYAQLESIAQCFCSFRDTRSAIEGAELMAKDDDLEMRELAKEELNELKGRYEELEQELNFLLLPKDPNDDKDIYLEIRAGTGGDEAAIFSGDLFRMYSRYAETVGWRVEIVSESLGEHGGYKEIIAKVVGEDVYSKLKFESGAHRVQRVPTTETQGRIHTSACTVAIMPEADEINEVEINPAEIRIDTFRASGAGGQHVNKTDSAIRITHAPTGIVVECQDERSQHKNKAKAMALLKTKIHAEQLAALQKEQAATRKSLVGSGDRSERIRTYNYPQGRITDHRINLTLYKLAEIMEGNLAEVIEPLVREYQAEQLAALGDN